VSTPDPGIYPGVPDTQYRAWDALGSTDIKTLAANPAGVFRFRRENPRSNGILDLGKVAHSLILEGREDAVTVLDFPDWKTKAAREARDAALKTALLAHEWKTVKRMRDAVFANPDAAALLTGHEAETSLRWDVDGVRLKGRLDGWKRDEGIIVDLKTARDASPRGFGRAAAAYGYHTQAAQYHGGLEALTGESATYYIVAVEKEPPFLTAVYEVATDQLDAGREAVEDGINAYREAIAADAWPTSYPSQPLDLPAWAYPEMELEF
jgi:hypothetical protein